MILIGNLFVKMNALLKRRKAEVIFIFHVKRSFVYLLLRLSLEIMDSTKYDFIVQLEICVRLHLRDVMS